MNGHASAQQQQCIRQLEERLQGNIASEDDILELALLAIEPGHNGLSAALLLRRIPTSNPLRNVWLAFADIYELMDVAALAEAIDACSAILTRDSDTAIKAAA